MRLSIASSTSRSLIFSWLASALPFAGLTDCSHTRTPLGIVNTLPLKEVKLLAGGEAKIGGTFVQRDLRPDDARCDGSDGTISMQLNQPFGGQFTGWMINGAQTYVLFVSMVERTSDPAEPLSSSRAACKGRVFSDQRPS